MNVVDFVNAAWTLHNHNASFDTDWESGIFGGRNGFRTGRIYPKHGTKHITREKRKAHRKAKKLQRRLKKIRNR